MDYAQPLSDEEFRELDAFLMADDLPEDCMDISMLDGFLTALAIGPGTIAPEQWLPVVWGETPDQPMPWKSEQQARRIKDLVMRHMSDVLWQLNEDPEHYAPVLYENGEGDEKGLVIDEWCSGFIEGAMLDQPSWTPLLESEEPFLLPILLCGTDWGVKELEAKPELAERYDEFVDALPDSVLAIRDYWAAIRKANSTLRREQPLPGRNDPCPCGSGKKYKKCCGDASRAAS